MQKIPFSGKVAAITGASSGIGKAVASALFVRGATLCLIGRDMGSLKAVSGGMPQTALGVRCYKADLTLDEDIERLYECIKNDIGYLDILVHSAGVFSMSGFMGASIYELDRQYMVNLRAPYLLTKSFLPMLKSRRGQIVFINSTAGKVAGKNLSQYAATKHALKAVADSLREEVNEAGVRVLSVYPGRTATPMQAIVHKMEDKAYRPERMLQPEDVAEVIASALALPETAEVTDINIRPFIKPD